MSNDYFLPAAWLSPGTPNRLSLFLLATGPEAALTKIDWALA